MSGYNAPDYQDFARKTPSFRAGMESAANAVRPLFRYNGDVGYRDYATDRRLLFGNLRYAVLPKR